MTILSFSRLSVFNFSLTFKTVCLWLHTVAHHCLLCFLPFLHSYFLCLPAYFTPSPMGLSTLIKAALLKGYKHLSQLEFNPSSSAPEASSFCPISPTWLLPLVQRTLLQGSQSNNAAFEAKAIITRTMHTLFWLSNPAYSLIYNRHGKVKGLRKAVWCLAATTREISTILVTFGIVLTLYGTKKSAFRFYQKFPTITEVQQISSKGFHLSAAEGNCCDIFF